MNPGHNLRILSDQLRGTHHGPVVTVTFTGSPTAVTAVARALASVVHVTSMRHTPLALSEDGSTPRIRLDATCHLPGRQS